MRKYAFALSCAVIVSSSTAFSAGFQISETSVSGLGRSFAGAGVAGDDASDMFYNPAGMFQREGTEFQVGVTYINADSKFNDKGSTTRVGAQTFPSQGGNSDGGSDAGVPSAFYMRPLGDDFKFGLAITSPYGLKTEYSSDWVGRYHARKTDLQTVDINPSIAYKINDKFAIGAGISIQYAEATLSQSQFTGTPVDGFGRLKGNDVGVGYNFGITYEPTDTTRMGIGFRSKVELDIEGKLRLELPNGAIQAISGNASVDLPESLYFSAAHDFSDKVTFYTSARWTNWSRFGELRVKFADSSGLPDQVTPENWNDAWTISFGADYDYNDAFTFRAGYAFDETPVSDAFRTPRIPDTNRHWLSAGVSYNLDKLTIDLGYAHLFSSGNNEIDSTIDLVNSQPGAATDTLRGSINGSAEIVGLSFNYKW